MKCLVGYHRRLIQSSPFFIPTPQMLLPSTTSSSHMSSPVIAANASLISQSTFPIYYPGADEMVEDLAYVPFIVMSAP